MSWAIPAGEAIQGYGSLKSGRDDANALENQGRTAQRTALQDEYAQRREARQRFGLLSASMAQAGGGVDEGVLRRSSLNAELDALNIRYAGQQRADEKFAEARSVRQKSKMLAGAQLLKAGSDAYGVYKTSHP